MRSAWARGRPGGRRRSSRRRWPCLRPGRARPTPHRLRRGTLPIAPKRNMAAPVPIGRIARISAIRPARAAAPRPSSCQASRTRAADRRAAKRARRLLETEERQRARRDNAPQAPGQPSRATARARSSHSADTAAGRLAELVARLKPAGRAPARGRRRVVRHQAFGRKRNEGRRYRGQQRQRGEERRGRLRERNRGHRDEADGDGATAIRYQVLRESV